MSFWTDNVIPMRLEFARVFPKIFIRPGRPKEKKRPLKIGIHRDLFEAFPKADPKVIRLALYDYVQGPKYLSACYDGANRIDLQGNITGQVTRRDRMYLLEMNEKKKRLQKRARDERNSLVTPDSINSSASTD